VVQPWKDGLKEIGGKRRGKGEENSSLTQMLRQHGLLDETMLETYIDIYEGTAYIGSLLSLVDPPLGATQREVMQL